MGVFINRLYTRAGDSGCTHLPCGTHIEKNHPIIEIVNKLDLLGSHIGVSRSFVRSNLQRYQKDVPHIEDVDHFLKDVQSHLFVMGSYVSTYKKEELVKRKQVQKEDITKLEREIDRYLEGLPPLKSFILQGGDLLCAHLHLARCSCRDLEFLLWKHQESFNHTPEIFAYINRLSDFFFALIRRLSHDLKVDEELWKIRD